MDHRAKSGRRTAPGSQMGGVEGQKTEILAQFDPRHPGMSPRDIEDASRLLDALRANEKRQNGVSRWHRSCS